MEKPTLPSSSSEEERIQFARDLFGKNIIASLDYWLNIAVDLIENEESNQDFVRKNALYKEDKRYREIFSKLDIKTKKTIMDLIKSTASGVIYSSLLKIDRFHDGDINIVYKQNDEKEVIPISSSKTDELHTELWNWIEKYSHHKESLLKQ